MVWWGLIVVTLMGLHEAHAKGVAHDSLPNHSGVIQIHGYKEVFESFGEANGQSSCCYGEYLQSVNSVNFMNK